MKICIDPGHGGEAPGAIGPSRTTEKSITLKMGLILHDELMREGHLVVITRTEDVTMGLRRRVNIAESFGADLFLSLHCNANINRDFQGIECYTSKGQTAADPWARKIQDALLAVFTDHKDFAGKGISEENFYVLINTSMPAVLIEAEFISHPIQEHFLKHNYRKIAETIAKSIR